MDTHQPAQAKRTSEQSQSSNWSIWRTSCTDTQRERSRSALSLHGSPNDTGTSLHVGPLSAEYAGVSYTCQSGALTCLIRTPERFTSSGNNLATVKGRGLWYCRWDAWCWHELMWRAPIDSPEAGLLYTCSAPDDTQGPPASPSQCPLSAHCRVLSSPHGRLLRAAWAGADLAWPDGLGPILDRPQYLHAGTLLSLPLQLLQLWGA